MGELGEAAKEAGLAVHLDGARIFNAAAALRVDAAVLTQEADTVTVSLDKCLSAPYGAILCGSAATMSEARRWRRMLGGHVRKVGMMASAGLVAFERMIDRIAEDNARADSIARRLNEIEGLVLDPYPAPSNLVMLDVRHLGVEPEAFVMRLEEDYGVRSHVYGRHRVRFAVHRHIGPAEADMVVTAVADLAAKLHR
jgi:threonine aldolase